MRCCPKCATRYEDTDIRSMCASCMVSLIACPDEAPQSTTLDILAQTPPTTDLLAAVPSPVLDDLTALPEIAAPEPESAATEIIDEPSPVDVTVSSMPESAPEPEPAPITMPEVELAEAPRAPVTPLLSEVATPAAVPTPHPPSTPTPTRTESTTEPKQRQLTAEEAGTGRTLAQLLSIVASVCTGVALISLFNIRPEDFTFLSLLLNGGLILLTVYLIRQAIYHTAIVNLKMKVLTPPRLGAPLQFEVNIGVLRTIRVNEAEITVTATERVVSSSSGKSQTIIQQRYARKINLCPPGVWTGGKQLTFHPQLPLPADLPPSFTGKSHHIDWSAALWVSIPGWYPDIRLRQPLVVHPISAVPLPDSSPHAIPLATFSDLKAVLTLTCAESAEHIPLCPVGSKLPFTLTIEPMESAKREALTVELLYVITGDGDLEQVRVDRVSCFLNGWNAGERQVHSGKLSVPFSSPVSYAGLKMRIEWALVIRRQNSRGQMTQQTIAIKMVPGNEAR